MTRWRTMWWVYVGTIAFVLTLLFNARQEAYGPANAGWTPSWPSMKVADVTPGGPMGKAGVRAGDVLEGAGGQPLAGMPDWFVARAHFERGRPIDLQIQRDGQHLRLHLIITDSSFRTWNRTQRDSVLALYLARMILLLLAMLVAFGCPQQQRSARLAALMFAVGAVAEGYPSSGWAAALHHLPAVLAIPICLASVSCLLAPIISIAFCGSFGRFRFSQSCEWLVVVIPTVLFGVPLVASSIAMIYAPSLLARPWPTVLTLAPVRLIQDIAGVTPLLFLSVWPFYRPAMHGWLLQLWLAMTVLYFVAGWIILLANYYRAESLQSADEQARCALLPYSSASSFSTTSLCEIGLAGSAARRLLWFPV